MNKNLNLDFACVMLISFLWQKFIPLLQDLTFFVGVANNSMSFSFVGLAVGLTFIWLWRFMKNRFFEKEEEDRTPQANQ